MAALPPPSKNNPPQVFTAVLLFMRYVVPHAPQEIVAVHPARTVLPFVTKVKVKHPLEAVISPGEVVPENVPMIGDAVVGPS